MSDAKNWLRQYVVNGDEDAFRQLVDHYIHLVWPVAFRITGDEGDAKDVTQLVFTLLAQKASRLAGHQNLAGWLHRSTTLEALKLNRQKIRRSHRETLLMQSATPCSKEDQDQIDSMLPLLDEALNGLGQADREALVLRFFEKKSFQQIGASLGLSEDAAQKRVSRALEKLRSTISVRGISASGGILLATMASAAAQTAPATLAAPVANTALSALTGTSASILWLSTSKLVLSWVVGVSAIAFLVSTPANQGVILTTPSAISPKQEASTTAAPVAQSISKPLDWRQLESADYRQYMANLRAVGVPEEMIQDIIVADLERHYAKKMREIASPGRAEWWKPQKQSEMVPSAQLAAVKKLQAEAREVERMLFGSAVDPQSRLDRLILQANPMLLHLSFLPEEKARIAAKALDDAGLRTKEVSTNVDEPDTRIEARLEVLKSILSPEELKEYERRCSTRLELFRRSFHYFEGTPEEFEQLATLHDKSGGLFWGDSRINKAKAFMTESRFREMQQAIDPFYGATREATERFGLPVVVADHVFQIKENATKDLEAIQKNRALTQQERNIQWQRLREKTDQAIQQEIGSEGLAVLKAKAPYFTKTILLPSK